ncbi:MAG: creatininase family protein [Spirochaetales bacterium]|nr:creatininase family protein [Spirochaetales bacterium]
MASVAWSSYTTREIRRIIDDENPVVIVSVGATEQHGPHLPLDTDTDIGQSLARRIAAASPIRALVLPTVWAGFSPHHMDFAGTITVRQSTLFAVVRDIIESVMDHGVTRILLMNSHGGNTALLKTVADEVGVRRGISPVYVTYWHMIGGIVDTLRRSPAGGMSHACELETSLKMVFSPEDVRSEAIEDVVIPDSEFYGVDMFSANRVGIYRPFTAWTSSGQIGAPSLATRKTGERLVAALVEQFVRLIRSEWEGR